MTMDFDYELIDYHLPDTPEVQMKRDWNNTCLAAGIPAITLDTCARIMAVLYVHGNNEAMTHSPMFLCDVEYISKRFKLYGTGIPDADFVEEVQGYVKELEAYYEAHKTDRVEKAPDEAKGIFPNRAPEWADKLFKDRYGIKLIN